MPYQGSRTRNHSATANLSAIITVLVGLAALSGWLWRIPTLRSILPGAVEMKANTALALMLCGAALWLLAAERLPGRQRYARIPAALVMVLALGTLAEYCFGWQLGLDEFLFKDATGAYNVFRGRMSPYSAIAFTAAAVALAAPQRDSARVASRAAAVLVIVIGGVSLLGYLWNAGELVTDVWVPPVALNTACCFVLLGVGILRLPRSAVTPAVPLAAVEIRILIGFLLALLLLLLGGGYTYRTSVEYAGSVEWVAHTQEVRTELADLYGTLAGAELAQRDYLLTTESARREEYTRMTQAVQTHLDELARLTADNREQQRNLTALRDVVARRLSVMASGLTAYEDFGLPAARAVLGLARRTSSMEDVRRQTERMDAAEVALLAARQNATAKARSTTLVSLLITLAVASTLFIALFRGIQREMKARRVAERAILELNGELAAKAAQLETTNKELESFSYSVSHDLRAPLRAIDGFALMLEEDYSGRLEAEGGRYLAVIRANSKRMGALIDDLLAFSRLGRLPVTSVEVNVDALVREVVEEALGGHSGPAPQIQIGTLPPVQGDRGLLRQVWANLISNAIKYSSKSPNPRIEVRGEQNEFETLYSIHDNGVGFDMNYVEKLFGVFQRLHRADEFTGTGVGLAIVHRVVTRHGGRVWAQGKIDQGAVFSFAIPRVMQHG